MTERSDQIKALANETRIEMLKALKQAGELFAHQESADPVKFGVCVTLIATHFGISQPTASRHIELLKRAGFITAQRWQKWTYCKRDEAALAEYHDWMRSSLQIEAL